MVMNKKMKQQLSILIVVAMLLILLIIIGVIFAPITSSNKGTSNPWPTTRPVVQQEPNIIKSYTVTVRMLDENYTPKANTQYMFSLNNTLLTTDANGYIVLNNLPEGIHTFYTVDANGNKTAVWTDFQLSSDGAVSVGYVFFDKDATVYIRDNGKSLVGVEEKDVPSDVLNGDSSSSSSDSNNNVTQVVKEDETYTNFSWMKNVDKEYGAYGISLYLNPDLFYEVLENDEYSYFNTFLLVGNNKEVTLKEAEVLAKHKKKMWLSVNDLITLKSFGGTPVSGNLLADWQDTLTEWATEIKAVAGDYFQGFYFDEPSYYYNSKDFTRITKYMRETFKLRTWACHCSAAYMTPYNRNKNIIGYKEAPNDCMVISAENHKYVTDVGWWRYGSVRDYGDIDVSFGEWKKAMSMLDKNTRKWYTPAIGAYYWDTLETDTLDIQYTMFKNNAKLEGFGGVMHYTMNWSSLSGRATPVNVNDERLTENDYYLDGSGKKVVSLDHNYSSVPDRDDAYMEGNGAYYVMEKVGGKYRWPMVRKYMDILGNGLEIGQSYDTILSKLEAVYKPDFSAYED